MNPTDWPPLPWARVFRLSGSAGSEIPARRSAALHVAGEIGVGETIFFCRSLTNCFMDLVFAMGRPSCLFVPDAGSSLVRSTITPRSQIMSSLCYSRVSRSSVVLCATALFSLVLGAPHLQAQVTISGTPQAESGTFTLSIAEDITFDINADGNATHLIFDEWVTAEGFTSTTTPPSTVYIGYQINSGAGQSASVSALRDNQTDSGGISINDGFLSFVSISVTNGDSLTLLAGSWDFGVNSSFNSQLVDGFTFTGDVFLLDDGLTQISNAVSLAAVPEPSTWASLVGMMTLGYSVWRRKGRETNAAASS